MEIYQEIVEVGGSSANLTRSGAQPWNKKNSQLTALFWVFAPLFAPFLIFPAAPPLSVGQAGFT